MLPKRFCFLWRIVEFIDMWVRSYYNVASHFYTVKVHAEVTAKILLSFHSAVKIWRNTDFTGREAGDHVTYMYVQTDLSLHFLQIVFHSRFLKKKKS